MATSMRNEQMAGDGPPGQFSPRQGRAPGPGPGQYRYTDAEKKVLNECSKESTLFRAFPLAAAGAGAAFYLVKLGKLSAHAKYGAFPKMAYAGFFGYIVGKISYINTCKEKMMRLENSPVADALRGKKDWRTLNQQGTPGTQDQTHEYETTSQSVQYSPSEVQMASPDTYTSMDIDPTKPPPAMTSDEPVSAFAPLEPVEGEQKKKVTYAELRKKHHEEEQHMVTPSFPPNYNPRSSTTPTPAPSRQTQQTGRQFDADEYFGKSTTKGKRVNKYGDVIEDADL